MNIIVDTSVWVSHFKQNNPTLNQLLLGDKVLCHPLIIGEIACGTPPTPRSKTLSNLQHLSQPKIATQGEMLYLIEENQLYGKGCGLIDIALLASALLTPDTLLWTSDKRLASLSQQFHVSFTD